MMPKMVVKESLESVIHGAVHYLPVTCHTHRHRRYLLRRTQTVGDDFGAAAAAAPPAADAVFDPDPAAGFAPPPDCTIRVNCGFSPSLNESFFGPTSFGQRACSTVLPGVVESLRGDVFAERSVRLRNFGESDRNEGTLFVRRKHASFTAQKPLKYTIFVFKRRIQRNSRALLAVVARLLSSENYRGKVPKFWQE